jgi:hypothetical protein
MRMILKVSMPTEVMNELMREGKLSSTMEKLLGHLKPEATYFIAMRGKRTALVVVDVAESSDLVKVAEPFFLTLGAGVEFYPAMIPEDLAKGAADFAKSAAEFVA